MTRQASKVIKEYLNQMRQAAVTRTQRIARRGEVAYGWQSNDAPMRLSRAISERSKILKLIKETKCP